VLLHLLAAALQRRAMASKADAAQPREGAYTTEISAIYIPPAAPFPQLEGFIAASVARYSLSLFRCPFSGAHHGDMKASLTAYKEKFPHVDAIFVGTRRNDPHGGTLDFLNPTDPDWPRFLRVHPIINWTYSAVWAFLRALDVPYCDLYDAGYTSLGSVYNTFRNPALRIEAIDGSPCTWKPAYDLHDDALERAGRGAADPSMAVTAPVAAES